MARFTRQLEVPRGTFVVVPPREEPRPTAPPVPTIPDRTKSALPIKVAVEPDESHEARTTSLRALVQLGDAYHLANGTPGNEMAVCCSGPSTVR